MAKKKRAVKKTRRKVSWRGVLIGDIKKKITIVLNNLLLFIALSLVSFVLYKFLQNAFLVNLFFIMSVVFGFVSVGFLITLLILFIIKLIKKR